MKRTLIFCLALLFGALAFASSCNCLTNNSKGSKMESKTMECCTSHNGNFQYSSDIAWEAPSEGVTRQIMAYSDDMMLVVVKFEKGAIGTMHTHPHSQASYVAQGEFDVTIDGVTKRVCQGDTFFAFPSQPHSVLAVEEGILVDSFNPAREDFLK